MSEVSRRMPSDYERRGHAAEAQMRAQGQPPLLLKPNGAPVFQDCGPEGALAGSLQRTMPRANCAAAADSAERTVKAHSLVLGKAIANQTSLAVFDMAKDSSAQDQSFPVKVIYVKPGLAKEKSLKAATAKAGELGKENTQTGNGASRNADQQLRDDVSLGEISGIFKKQKVQPNKRGSKSAPQKEAEAKVKKQREYAEQVRKEAKAKQLARQASQPVATKEPEQVEEPMPADDPLLRVPHAQNRFKGEFKSLTKELFHKAQAKVRDEKRATKMAQEGLKAQKELEKRYQEEIKLRNAAIINEQRQRGTRGPTLLEKEEAKKRQQFSAEIHEKMELRKLKKMQREQDHVARMGLALQDKKKRREFEMKKKRRLEEEQAAQRLVDEENRQKLLLRDKKILNKDLIDFTDPDGIPGQQREEQQYQDGLADEAAEPVVDRKAILREQKLKRKQQELEKQREQEQERQMKERRMYQLELHLKQQRDEIARKQAQMLEKEARRARSIQPKIYNQAGDKRPKSSNQKKDRSKQLSELRGWIEEQMRLEDLQSPADESAADMGQSASKSKAKSSHGKGASLDFTNPNLVGHQLPGNSTLPLEDERKVMARDNRYGLDGDNGYDEIVKEQRIKEGWKSPTSQNQKENILNFTQKEASPQKSEDSYDYQPVKEEKRKIVNQAIADLDIPSKVPGIINVQDEAARQQAEEKRRMTEAAVVMQKWARGWQDRKRTRRLRSRMKKEIDYAHDQFTQQFKLNDEFNIQRFYNEKQRLRKLNQTENVDEESISEMIGESQSYKDVDLVQESYIQSHILASQSGATANSRGAPQMQNFFNQAPKASDTDPLSLISIFAKRNTLAASPEQMIPEKEKPGSSPKPDRRAHKVMDYVEKRRESRRRDSKPKQTKKQKKPSYMEDEIEEDIVQSSKDKQDDEYSSEFVSEHIEADSIPSYRGSPLKQSRQDSSVIEESIQESIAASKERRSSKAGKIQSSGTQESIQEDLKKSQSIQSATIEDEIGESKGLDDGSDEISEESYLKGSGDSGPASSFQKPTQPITTFKPKPVLPNKIERIRENIEEDYENDGFEPLHGSLKADKLKEMQIQAKKEDAERYRMSKDIIQDFEENKGLGTVEHKRLMNDLAEELKRYEAAVNGSLFVEQFQNIVQKSLAQKDVLMLGQRLSQLEQENKHKQEIADIREEQIRMMSQLMLLNASSGAVDKRSGDKIQNQQAEIMHNIQKLIDKPIIIQGDIEASMASASHQSHVNVLESVGSRLSNAKAGGAAQKFTSVEQSNNIAEDIDEAIESEDEIEDEIESDIQAAKSEESDSIKESIEQSRQSEKKLQNARRMLGSEQSIIDKSKNMLSDKSKKASSVFEKNTFQNYTNNKFKDLLTNESSAMEQYLDNIEKAVTKKSDAEAKQLKKQLDQRKISPKTFKKKASQLEKWVSRERAEINQKRSKVRDTCADIGHFMKKLEKDKLMMLDQLPSGHSTPRGLRRSASNISGASDSEGLQAVQEQLRELKNGQIGGEKPETKYLNKKREFVRQLMKEKKDAVERGVKEKMRNLESDMIDDMLYHALNLDVDKEVDNRIAIARRMVEEGRIDESASKSAGPYRDGHSKTSASKKNVTFQSSQNDSQSKYSSSAYSRSQQHQASSFSRSMNEKHHLGGHEENDDVIGESIQIEETQSYQPSHSASASKASMSQSRRSNAQLKESAGKHSRKSNQDSDHKPSVQNVDDEDENSLARDEEEIQESYSNEFIEESIASASLSENKSQSTNLKSKQALQSKAADIEESGYSEAFEEASIGQSQSTNLRNKLTNSQQNQDIEVVNEEDDNLDSSAPASQSASRRSKASSKRSPKHSQAQKEFTPRDLPAESVSDLEDREILESTQSVDWQIVLQERAKKASLDQQSPPGSSARGGSGDLDREQESEVQDEVELKAQDNLADLDSCPSGSIGASNEADHELQIDQITDDLLESILRDFKQDSSVKMVVEDDVNENDFEDHWPYSLDKKVAEPEPVKHVPQAPTSPSTEADPPAQQENDAKKKHDEQMRKYHAEQKMIQEQHRKVEEYLDFIINVVDKEVIQAALQKPIEHDPLKVLEKIQAFDTEDEIELTNLGYSQQQSALSPELFDEIERRFDELKAEASAPSEKDESKNDVSSADGARTYLHLAIFDAFNDALDQGRPYQFKGLPNPWSRQTRVTNETLSSSQVDTIIQKAKERVMEWQKTGAGTRFAPPPPPPPLQGEYDPPQPPAGQESEEERNKAERQERLGLLLTKEVHQREQDWLDYEIEDTQVRFDLADMILEELADEATQFLLEKAGGSLPASLEHY